LKPYVDLTWQEVDGLDRSKCVIALPIGSIEQHGPQLPLSTDTLTVEHIAKEISGSHGAVEWILAPSLVYTYAKPSQVYPGTLSTNGETLIRTARDVMRSFLDQGFRKILVINGHMENTDFLIEGIALASEGLKEVKVILCNWWEFVPDEAVKRIFGPQWNGWVDEHAALVETALMLHIAPHLVRMNKLKGDQRRSRFEFRILPWEIENYPLSGVFSAVEGASGEKGKALIRVVLEQLGTVVKSQFAE
jgi:creatinine amidohydrolase